MEDAQLTIGRRYALREKRSRSSPLIQVKLVDKVGRKGKVKIRFEAGDHPGLEEYVDTRQLLVPWGERTALLRDEKRMAELEAHAKANADKALACAASTVLESTGESGAYASEKTSWLTEDELQRICDRAGISSQPRDLHPLSFRDRHGRVHLSLDGMVRLAQAFAAAEPRAVIEYIDDQEDEYRLRGNAPGDRWWHRYLREQAPGFALARRWAGLEEEADGLRQEIARLRALVSSAASELKAAGQERKAQRLIRALEGR